MKDPANQSAENKFHFNFLEDEFKIAISDNVYMEAKKRKEKMNDLTRRSNVPSPALLFAAFSDFFSAETLPDAASRQKAVAAFDLPKRKDLLS